MSIIDKIKRLFSKPTKVEFVPQVVLSDEVKQKMAEDPEMAAAIMMVTTQMQKAMRDFHEGKFKSMDEALAAHGGKDVEHLSSQEFTERTGQEAETATKYGSVVFDMNDLPHTNETKH